MRRNRKNTVLGANLSEFSVGVKRMGSEELVRTELCTFWSDVNLSDR